MEDNEFEEVTIISHTDRPQRVFSEKSIEKLKDQVSLEIVKEINGTEDKTYSDDPRLAPGLRELEKLKQDHFGEGAGKIRLPMCYFISRVAGESGQYLLGDSTKCLVSNGVDSKVFESGKAATNVVPWGDHFIIFFPRDGLKIICLKTLEEKRFPESSQYPYLGPLKTTKNYLYSGLSSDSNCIVRWDRNLKSETISNQYGARGDFFVCPKTETITTLLEVGSMTYIKRDDKQEILYKDFPNSFFDHLKKMYSDHFLVGEINPSPSKTVHLHLVDYWSLKTLTYFKLSCRVRRDIQNIRLLAPRQGISCFLVLMTSSLELFCEYRLKLYHLKTLEIQSYNMGLTHQMDDNWIVNGNSLYLVRLDLSVLRH